MTHAQLMAGLILGGSALLLATGGCPVDVQPASTLRGTWDITVDETIGLSDSTITFDRFGNVTEVTTTVVGQSRTLSPTDSSSNVEDGDVDVVANFPGGTFDLIGTLSEDQEVITGTVTITNDVDPDVSVLDVPTTLTRRPVFP